MKKVQTTSASLNVLIALMGASALAGEVSLVPPAILPDGKEFKTWEGSPAFSRTYHVSQKHPGASDGNPGTAELPFLTIHRAAEVVGPGKRVVVAEGVYRERVAPARGGTGPDRMIGYEAAPGAEVVLSGSEVLGDGWAPSTREGRPGPKSVWMVRLGSKRRRRQAAGRLRPRDAPVFPRSGTAVSAVPARPGHRLGHPGRARRGLPRAGRAVRAMARIPATGEQAGAALDTTRTASLIFEPQGDEFTAAIPDGRER